MNKNIDDHKYGLWWKNAVTPELQDICDKTFTVQILTGAIPDLSFLGHRKWLGAISGHNIIAGKKCGHFKLIWDEHFLQLRYQKYKIIDIVRIMKDGNLIGKFYWRGKFRGWFMMYKVNG
jgi:hypothetical protein